MLSCSTESPLLTLHKKKNKNNIKRWKYNQLDYEVPIYKILTRKRTDI